jgi:hypothetical protein
VHCECLGAKRQSKCAVQNFGNLEKVFVKYFWANIVG